NLGLDYHSTFNPGIPTHNTNVQQPLGLGVESANMQEIYRMTDSMIKDLPKPPPDGKPTMRLKKDGTPDLRYKSLEQCIWLIQLITYTNGVMVGLEQL
ncbi:MAG: hypothetical protein ACW98W_14270, partial [Candidatus Hodarchaeales archaeon]